MPVEILGLNGAPSAGDRIGVVENEARAREISEYRQRLSREKAVARAAGSRGSLEQMMTQLQTSELSEAALVLKADVQGSAEAIQQALEKMNTDEVAAGCRITEGKVERGNGVRLLRDNVVIHEGQLSTLKRFKDEVSEVQGGQECGMAFENYQDMRQGDVIECFRVEHIERSL